MKKYSAAIFCSILSFSSCIYTDAAGIQPPGSIPGEAASKRMALAMQIASDTVQKHLDEKIGLNSSSRASTLYANYLNSIALDRTLKIQNDRYYRPDTVEACFKVVAFQAPLAGNAVWEAIFDKSNFFGTFSDANFARWVLFFDFVEKNCDVQSTGRVVELGPLSF